MFADDFQTVPAGLPPRPAGNAELRVDAHPILSRNGRGIRRPHAHAPGGTTRQKRTDGQKCDYAQRKKKSCMPVYPPSPRRMPRGILRRIRGGLGGNNGPQATCASFPCAAHQLYHPGSIHMLPETQQSSSHRIALESIRSDGPVQSQVVEMMIRCIRS